MLWNNYPYTNLQDLNLDGLIQAVKKNANDLQAAYADLQQQINDIIITPIVLTECFYNVKNAGAVGDGVTDDSDAFRTALAAHRAIYVPDGRYLVSDVDLAGTPLLMLGTGTIVIQPGTDYGFKWFDAPNVVFMGLTFEKGPNPKIAAGNDYLSDTNGGAAMWLGSGNQGTGEQVAFYNCRFVCTDYAGYDWNTYGCFVHVMNLHHLTVMGCRAEHVNLLFRGTRSTSVLDGYYARVNINHITFIGNVFNQLTSAGAYNHCVNIDNEPLEMDSSYANDTVIFVGNGFTAESSMTASNAFGVGYCKHAYYAGNVMRNYALGIDCDNPKGATITGNVFDAGTVKGGSALRVGTNTGYHTYHVVENVTVTDNVFINHSTAVSNNVGNEITIANNVVQACDMAFYSYGATNMTISGNAVRLNDAGVFIDIRTGTGIQVQGNLVSGATNSAKITAFRGWSNNTNFNIVDNTFSQVDPDLWEDYNNPTGLPTNLQRCPGLTDTIRPYDKPTWQYGGGGLWTFEYPDGFVIKITGAANTFADKLAGGGTALELPQQRHVSTAQTYPHLAMMMLVNGIRINFNSNDMDYKSMPVTFNVRNIHASTDAYFNVSDAVGNAGLSSPGGNSFTITPGNQKSFLLYNDVLTEL